jgi:hypothetical protein
MFGWDMSESHIALGGFMGYSSGSSNLNLFQSTYSVKGQIYFSARVFTSPFSHLSMPSYAVGGSFSAVTVGNWWFVKFFSL